jgi:hypothetical protein
MNKQDAAEDLIRFIRVKSPSIIILVLSCLAEEILWSS